MIFRSYVTMDSPRAVREILLALARRAGQAADDAARSASLLKRWQHDPPPLLAGATQENLETQARIDRAKADTSKHLLIAAWMAAGYDDEGRQWVSRQAAVAFTDAMITIARAQRGSPSPSRLDLGDIFHTVIETS